MPLRRDATGRQVHDAFADPRPDKTGSSGGGGGTGTVTDITAGVGLTGTPNPITTSGTIDLADTAVTPATYGSATTVGQFTVDQQGRITAAADVTITGVTPSAHNLLSAAHGDTVVQTVSRGSLIYGNTTPAWDELVIGAANHFLGSDGTDAAWTAPGALTRVDDTNVTLTLGGAPTTALLRATSLTLGWTGTLAIGRGGTGAGTALDGFNALSPLTTRGDMLTRDASNNVRLGIGTADQVLTTNGTDPAWGKLVRANVTTPTGTTDTFVFATQPTFVTDITTPIVYGAKSSSS